MKSRKLRPVLDGAAWTIGDNPDLGPLQGLRAGAARSAGVSPQECVDHHVFQSKDGRWQLWGCIRGTAVGRILYRWEGESLTEPHWKQTGEVIRADRAAGESIDDWFTREWMQSPFVVVEGGRWFMFYGGHGTGQTAGGWPAWSGRGEVVAQMDCQICLMTSPDGRAWTRHRNAAGQSRVFAGPGETRDPCLIRIEGLWHMYCAGFHDGVQSRAGFYVRTSEDLINWSDWQLVHYDLGGRFGSGNWDCECPHVVFRDGFYYLFRTENYVRARTHVFRSEDPADFGIGDAGSKYVGLIRVAAPEVIVDPRTGEEYITSNHDVDGGTTICRLRWVEE